MSSAKTARSSDRVEDASLEAKYAIQTSLHELPTTWEALELWMVAEFKTPKSQWNATSSPSQCTIPNAEIGQATLDPLRRTLGYLFERCGRTDFEPWFEKRFVVDEFFSVQDGKVGRQRLLYQNPEGNMRPFGDAFYVWPDSMEGHPLDPKFVSKYDFAIAPRDNYCLSRLAIEVEMDVIGPARLAPVDTPLTMAVGQNAVRTPRGAGDQRGGNVAGDNVKCLQPSSVTL
jgi:hypothetical protein